MGAGKLSFWLGLLAGVILGVGLALALDSDLTIDLGDGVSTGDDAMQVILDNYWKDPNDAKLEDSSVNGMVDYLHRSFEDRFTHYFNPEDFEAFENSTAGHFFGIGLGVNGVDRGLKV